MTACRFTLDGVSEGQVQVLGPNVNDAEPTLRATAEGAVQPWNKTHSQVSSNTLARLEWWLFVQGQETQKLLVYLYQGIMYV